MLLMTCANACRQRWGESATPFWQAHTQAELGRVRDTHEQRQPGICRSVNVNRQRGGQVATQFWQAHIQAPKGRERETQQQRQAGMECRHTFTQRWRQQEKKRGFSCRHACTDPHAPVSSCICAVMVSIPRPFRMALFLWTFAFLWCSYGLSCPL